MRGVTIAIDKNKIKGEYLNGAYSELAGILGIDAVLKLHSKYRGTQVFFPVELFSRDFIIKQIVDEYDGYNIRELATKYGNDKYFLKRNNAEFD